MTNMPDDTQLLRYTILLAMLIMTLTFGFLIFVGVWTLVSP